MILRGESHETRFVLCLSNRLQSSQMMFWLGTYSDLSSKYLHLAVARNYSYVHSISEVCSELYCTKSFNHLHVRNLLFTHISKTSFIPSPPYSTLTAGRIPALQGSIWGWSGGGKLDAAFLKLDHFLNTAGTIQFSERKRTPRCDQLKRPSISFILSPIKAAAAQKCFVFSWNLKP